jgi:hypothetical protein
MNTYVQTPTGFAAIRASAGAVRKLPQVQSGAWSIVPATRALRRDAALGVNVRTVRILPDGRIGAL